MTLAIVLLAAGKGTRMNSKHQKILHEVGGKPMVQHIFDTAVSISHTKPVLVVSHDEDGVQKLIGEQAAFVEQREKLGTGHATLMAKQLLEGKSDQVIVTYGDMPLLQPETLHKLADTLQQKKATLSLLTVKGSTESSFGRIVRGEEGQVLEIVEVAEAKRRKEPERWLDIDELNVGVYCFDADFLWAELENLPERQARNGVEYYLTDLVETAVSQNRRVEAVIIEDKDESLGAGTRQELVAVERAFRRRTNRYWLNRGVTIVNPDETYIDQSVTIGQDSIIWPNTFLQGRTIVGEDCTVGPNTLIRDCQIGNGCTVEQSLLINGTIKDGEVIRNG